MSNQHQCSRLTSGGQVCYNLLHIIRAILIRSGADFPERVNHHNVRGLFGESLLQNRPMNRVED
jgi:hypothetical protein